jgi:hypothetical protein
MDNQANNIEDLINQMQKTENGNGKAHAVPNYPVVVSGDLQAFGSEQSAKVSGNPHVLNTHFEWFFQDAMRNANGKNAEQEKKISDLKKEITGLESNNDKLLNDIKDLEVNITYTEKEIEKNKQKEALEIEEKKDIINKKNVEIDRIKNGDYSVLGTEVKPGDRIGYYIGLGILCFLTLYLVIFYTSVIYSAFILDPIKAAADAAMKGGAFSSAIINLNAIPDTYGEHGLLGVLFLLFATFMFIGMGYLLHKFNINKQYLKAGFVYAFTFSFDAVLAYTIVRNIYHAKQLTGTGGDNTKQDWNWLMALGSMDFLIILMAGFAAYIIWGFILDYMISEYDNIVPARVGIKTRETEIIQIEELIQDMKDRFSEGSTSFFSKIENMKIAKNELRTKFDNNVTAVEIKKTDITSLERTVSISIGDLKTKISQFLIGWCAQIKMTNQEDSKAQISECHYKLDTFYKTIKID